MTHRKIIYRKIRIGIQSRQLKLVIARPAHTRTPRPRHRRIAHLVPVMQMQTKPRTRENGLTRPALWLFEKLDTVRNRLIRRAGRLHTPNGKLTLTMSENEAVQRDYERIVTELAVAA